MTAVMNMMSRPTTCHALLRAADAIQPLQSSEGAMDITRGAAALAARPVLLVTGARDDVTPTATNHDPMLAALRNAGGKQVSELRLDSDHAFSDARIALARGVVDFLQQHCR